MGQLDNKWEFLLGGPHKWWTRTCKLDNRAQLVAEA